jgi:Cu(I)/Ag(I) efflux system membrane protein CusA/SilA
MASISDNSNQSPDRHSVLDKIIWFCLNNKLVVVLLTLTILGWGVLVAPFDWNLGGIRSDSKALPELLRPVPVDAIPDIGENQQIVFTQWMGRSPQDVEDQIGYPLTVALLGIPEVKTIRSYSMFGFSTIYVIFNEKADFYWSRTRVLEKLNSLPNGTLPEGVQPALGPDATALGQVFWYTLEGHDPDGNVVGGWDLHELRTIQDWHVRYALTSSEGISEVGSIGGFVQEYQIDVDPDAMRAHDISLSTIFQAVRMSNVDVGARTIELSKAEYVIRGLGFIGQLSDIEQIVVKVTDNVPITVREIAKVSLGPAARRGALDKEGAETVGGVCVVRYGFNPLEAIKNVKAKIEEIAPGLPTKVIIDYSQVSRIEAAQYATEHNFDAYVNAVPNDGAWVKHLLSVPREEWPSWVTTSQVTVVPFYDRTGLIYETLGTLNAALTEEILVTVIVILVLLRNFRSSVLISALLPLAVLISFIGMKVFKVDANIVALSGIAIAIGTMVDMGIILCENIIKHLDEAPPDEDRLQVIFRGSREVAGALLAAVSTTIISFLPVFTMIGAEGKLFRPLAFTKTFALIASAVVAIVIIPPAAHLLFATKVRRASLKRGLFLALLALGIGLIWLSFVSVGGIEIPTSIGVIVAFLAAYELVKEWLPAILQSMGPWLVRGVPVAIVGILVTEHWMPLGPQQGLVRNLLFVGGLISVILGFFHVFQTYAYEPILRWCLRNKTLFLCLPACVILLGICIWLGVDRIFGFVPSPVRETKSWARLSETFPGLGKEFMPPLDEGSFLYMPTTMPHASIGESLDVLQLQDKLLISIPEVESVVGKLGRVDSPLDPAPISMIETVISYKPEYKTDKDGHRLKFRFDEEQQEFARDGRGNLIEDAAGRPFRQWRDHIRTPDDIWKEITAAADIPGTTSAPKLQPIAARIVMLQSGMRAPMGLKVKGPDLKTIEQVALEIERHLKEVPTVQASAVIADRIVGKPYLEIDIDRAAIKRYGLHIRNVQDVIEVAIGGRTVTTTVEGRERYPVRIRYARELRDDLETLGRILVPTPTGAQIPLEQLAEIRYVRGPQVIKSEDTFLVGYVLFDMKSGHAEVDVVEDCEEYLAEKVSTGELILPPGVSYAFAGNYENQLRSQKTLMIVLPVALFAIFLNLYFQFRAVITTSLVFSGVLVAWAGGFIMVWLYGQPWFLDFELFDTNMRTLFQVHPINLSVAVWVGFLALFGIADDDGVVMTTYLEQSFKRRRISTSREAREATVVAGMRRIRPCLMTTATTMLALVPVLTSTGRGSDVMVPMAIPSFGGMLIAMMSMFIVPVLYCSVMEWKLKLGIEDPRFSENAET